MLARDIVEDDLTRLRRYIALVKTVAIKYGSWMRFRLSPEVWDDILEHVGPSDFPQLDELVVDQGVLIRGSHQPSYPPPIHRFLGASLLSVLITAPQEPSDGSEATDDEEHETDAKELISLCAGLPTRSSLINCLQIDLTRFPDAVAPLLSSAIPNLFHLTVCCLSGVIIDADAFQYLGNLPLLI